MLHVISPVGGRGNRADLELVAPLLEQNGFEVTRYPVERRNGSSRLKHVLRHLPRFRGRFAVNLFLGPIFPEWLPFAARNVWVPNPEGFHEYDRKYLRCIDLVLAKTRLAEQIFRDLGRPVEFVGFTSHDQFDPSVLREPTRFFHAASSPYKGTSHLLACWKNHPEWPDLTVIHNGSTHPDLPNVRLIREHLPNEEYRRLQNSHGVHLCCSEIEGFGHYIMEALSCAAATLTTDAAPMNELVQPDRGILVGCLEPGAPVGLCRRHPLDPRSLEAAVAQVVQMSPDARRHLGESARSFFPRKRSAVSRAFSRGYEIFNLRFCRPGFSRKYMPLGIPTVRAARHFAV